MTTLEVLKAARARVAKGWIQGRSFGRGEEICASAAIEFAGCHGPALKGCVGCRAGDLFRGVIGGSIVAWNDTPGRTHAEVVAAFDKAILLADGATAPNASSETASSQGENQ